MLRILLLLVQILREPVFGSSPVEEYYSCTPLNHLLLKLFQIGCEAPLWLVLAHEVFGGRWLWECCYEKSVRVEVDVNEDLLCIPSLRLGSLVLRRGFSMSPLSRYTL